MLLAVGANLPSKGVQAMMGNGGTPPLMDGGIRIYAASVA
jgi:hypothetical protein